MTDSATVVLPGSTSSDSGPSVPDFAIWRCYVIPENATVDPDDVRLSGFVVQFDSEQTPSLLMPLHPLTDGDRVVVTWQAGIAVRDTISRTMISEVYGAGDGSLQKVGSVRDLADPDADVADGIANNLALVYTGPSSRLVRPLELSSTKPKIGDSVWLAAAVYAGAPPSRPTHEAIVTAVSDAGEFAYRFENSRLSLQAADGAPLLNRAGDVIGMHFGPNDDSGGSHVDGFGVTAAELLAWKGSLDSLSSGH